MGSGHIAGYAVVDLQGTYHISQHFDFFARCRQIC